MRSFLAEKGQIKRERDRETVGKKERKHKIGMCESERGVALKQ